MIGPLEEEEVFNQDDFLLLENIILKTSGERIKSKVTHFGIEEDRYAPGCFLLIDDLLWANAASLFRASDLVMKVDALLSSQPKGEARVEYGFADDRHRYCFEYFYRYRAALEKQCRFTSTPAMKLKSEEKVKSLKSMLFCAERGISFCFTALMY